ncbi:hypothetical protein [Promicromonospora sp. MEB111]|uniref:hypothetical protein n=1 Tax=Promicromonospora sp. MEB111 TaxID=3040301 RepID=UPI00254BFB0E|nr:hypothetical protein [Promicromonospora sp. MEB111]
MSFLDVIAALGRRWIVTVVGLLATAGLVYGASTIEPPVYTARALVLLVPSEQVVGEGGNPFLALGGLDLPARVVVAYYESDVAKERFSSGSADAEYVVAIEESTRGPVISVDVTDVSPAATLETLELLTSSIPVELERLQEEVDAPKNTVVSTLVLAKDERAKTDNSGTVRMVIAAGGIGLVATVVAAVAVDGLVRSRTRGRRQAAPEGPGADPAVPAPSAAGSSSSGPKPAGPNPDAKADAKPAKPATVRLPAVRPPSVQPPASRPADDRALPSWPNLPLDSRDRRRDDASARASSAESR